MVKDFKGFEVVLAYPFGFVSAIRDGADGLGVNAVFGILRIIVVTTSVVLIYADRLDDLVIGHVTVIEVCDLW